jgi:hypothetical protein
MKPKDADLVLSCFADFAYANPNDPELEKEAMRLIDIVAGVAGLQCRLESDGNIKAKHSVELHGEINHYLESLTHSDGESKEISLEGVIRIRFNLGGDKSGLSMDIESMGIRGVVFAMFYCCQVFGAKKVVTCEGCGKYVFVAGHHRKYCRNANTCRQKVHRRNKTDEDRNQENAKRRAEYKRGKPQ